METKSHESVTNRGGRPSGRSIGREVHTPPCSGSQNGKTYGMQERGPAPATAEGDEWRRKFIENIKEVIIMRRCGVWAMVLLCMFLLLGCNDTAKQKEIRAEFDAICIGENKDSAIRRMGEPWKSNYKNILGLTHETLMWKDHAKTYRVEFLNGKVVCKSHEQLDERRERYAIE